MPYTSAYNPSNHTIDKMLEVGWSKKMTPTTIEIIPPTIDNHSLPVALSMADINPKKPAMMSHAADKVENH